MALARKQDISIFRGDDLQEILAIVGYDMTGETGTFTIAETPEATALIAATVTVDSVALDSDGVPTSIIKATKAKADIESAIASLSAADPGADITLYYNFRVSDLPDTFGDAEKTLLFGNCIIKGSI